jgi:hypothetical protein
MTRMLSSAKSAALSWEKLKRPPTLAQNTREWMRSRNRLNSPQLIEFLSAAQPLLRLELQQVPHKLGY